MVQEDLEVGEGEGSKMNISLKKKSDNELIFILEDADVSFVNAIRRICTMEVPSIAIESVEIIKNDSSLFDEVLAHRLGLIPLGGDSESLKAPNECDCDDYCSSCSVSLVLKDQGPKIVYSKDLNPTDPNIKPVYDTIPILKLKEDQEVELQAIAQLGIGLEHAKWLPTTSCAYKYYPMISIEDTCETCGKCVDECPRSVLKIDKSKGKVIITDLENCSLCKSCMKVCETGAIHIDGQKEKFIFRIETDGSMPPEEVLVKACDKLSDKSGKIIEFLK
jgi:DNA-directed RNA polymerase subunit D